MALTKMIPHFLATIILCATLSVNSHALLCVNINLTLSDTLCFDSCQGTASIIVSGGTGPYTIQWRNNVSTPIGNGSFIDSLCAGNYSIFITDLGEVCDTLVFFTIHQYNPLNLTASSDTTVCSGTQASLSTVITGGAGGPFIYSWNPMVAFGPNATVFPTTSTTYSVAVVDSKGCVDATKYITVTVPAPLSLTVVPDTAFIGLGDTAVFTATASGGLPPINYSWSSGAGTGQTVYVSPPFNFSYTAYASSTCGSANKTVRVVIVDVTGIEVSDASGGGWGLELFPNPVGTTLYVQLVGKAANNLCNVILFNIAGEVVYSQGFFEDRFAIEVAAYPTGTYILVAQTNRQVFRERFIKQ